MQRLRDAALTMILLVLAVFWTVVLLAVLRWRAGRGSRDWQDERQWHDYPVGGRRGHV